MLKHAGAAAAAIACLLLLLAAPATAQAQFTYTTNADGTLTITRYTGANTVVVIPTNLSGLTVTGLGNGENSVFKGIEVTSVTIAGSVTNIGDYAFESCSGLTGITIPNSVTNIGDYAFLSCSGLTNVTIGNGVTNIGDYAFESCSGLTSITIGSSVTNIGESAFQSCSGLTSVTIPNSVTNLGVDAFLSCSGLTNVTIGSSVSSIGESAFQSCSGMTSLTIGSSVTNIGEFAFLSCSSLTGVYFQGNAPAAGSTVFETDTNATAYYLPGTTGWGEFSDSTGIRTAEEAQYTLTNLHSFSVFPNGSEPVAGLVQGSNGNFYGTTSGGGTNGGYGTVYEVTTNGVAIVLHEFTGGSDGANPQAGLVLGNDGNFYGTTQYGGDGSGTVFRITPNGTFTNLYSFTGGDDGARPRAALALGSDGNFYGTTSGGGSNYDGNIFKITTNGTLTSLYSFTNGSDGATPYAALVQGSNGNFYGTAQNGGANGDGTVFQIATNGQFSTLYAFGSVEQTNVTSYPRKYPCGIIISHSTNYILLDGRTPNGLVLGLDGDFYGTTQAGGTNGWGTIFKITTDGTLTSLHSFSYGSDGVYPEAALVQDNGGNFYGTTSQGGTDGNGTIFQITTNGALTSLYSFTNGIDGANPQAALARGSDGNYYGTATGGGVGIGSGGNGTVFEIATNGTFTALYAFPGANDGQNANALVHGSDGNFYGTTQNGGTNGANGNVFKITTNGTLISLYSFTGGNDGANPDAALVQGSDGNFYGTAQNGGNYGNGTIFQITTNGALTSLYSFTGGNDGANPGAALVQGGDGSFYGTTPYGGANGDGTVFRITSNGQLRTLYGFGSVEQIINVTSYTNVDPCGTTNISYSTNYLALDGASPNGLVLGFDGNLYGTTQSGGTNGNNGTVFQITHDGTFTSLYSFTGGADGGGPSTSLVQGGDGNFYGTTTQGGTGDPGTVFQVTPNGSLTTLYSFTGGYDGYSPSSLLAGTDGNFYGTTASGGANYNGNVFQVMTNGTFNNLYSFTGGDDGGSPSTSLVQGSDGSLYGTTTSGAVGGYGDVFRLSGSGLPSPLPLITIQPANPPPTLAGFSATFTVVALGGTPLSYQWQHDGAPLSAGDDFSGLDIGTLTVDAAAAGDAGTYSVVVSNSYGLTTSSNAVLTLLSDTNAMEDFEAGTNYVAVGDYALANLSFANALTFSPTNDTYNFFYAATELLSLPQEPAGSNFLSRLGFGSAGRDIFNWQAQEPTNAEGHLVIPVTTPPLNADEFTAQLRTNILPAIIAAQNNLAQITDTNFTVYLSSSETHAGAVAVDWGDVQMLQAMCDAAQLFIYTVNSWNVDVQLSLATNIVANGGGIEALLTNYPSLLTTTSTADLPAAQGAFTNAISNYFAASQFIRNRSPGETFLFNLSTNDLTKESQFRQILSNLLASLNGPVVVFTNSPNITISAQAFFSGNFNLRSYLPEFQGDAFVWDTFPDTTFGGIFTGLTEKQVGKGFLKRFHVGSVLDLPGTSLSVLYNFTNFSSQKGVVQGPDGTLYGTLADGGPYVDVDAMYGLGYGSIFQVTTNGQFNTLYSFGSNQTTIANSSPKGYFTNYNYPLDGAYPRALVLGSDGNLYGTTSTGGVAYFTNTTFVTNGDGVVATNIVIHTNYYFGTVFKITTNGQLTTLYNFGGNADLEAAAPFAALVEGSDGRFYGTTEHGGANGGAGTVFAISTNGACTSLYSFSGGSDGGYPVEEPLVQGTNGNFYGTTPSGGSVGDQTGFGTIFMIDPSQPGQISTLYTFGTQHDEYGDPLDGAVPNGLVQGADGNFYGTTQYGGANDDYLGYNGGSFYFGGSQVNGDGTLFSISPTGTFSNLLSFDENFSDGYNPIGSLLAGPGGAFYGVASAGGANQRGAVFIFNATNGTGTNIVWLTKSSGCYSDNLQNVINFFYSINGFPVPVPSLLTQGLDGNLYGTTTDGGTNGSGTVYQLSVRGLPVLNWPAPSPIIYGTPLSSNQLDATANVPGSFAYTPTYGTVLNAGTNTLSVVFTPTDTNDYSGATLSVTLVVLPGPMTITFDDIDAGSEPFITNGYHGFNWTNFGVVVGSSYPHGYGYYTGVVSSPNVAYNLYGNPASISGATPFTLISGYFTAASVNGLSLVVVGLNGATTQYSNTHSLNTTGPILITFPNMPVTKVNFSTAQNSQFVLDNLVVNGGGGVVGPIAPLVTWANPSPITYGTALSSYQLDATANTPGSFAYTPTNGTVLNTGTYALSVIFTPTDTNDYSNATNSVSLVVSPAPLTVTAADASRLAGTANPVFSGTITGLTNGDNITATYSTTATSNSPAGTYPIVPSLVDPNDRLTNYTTNLVNGTLTVFNPGSGSVAVYGADESAWLSDVTNNISNTLLFSNVIGVQANAATPTLAQLEQYSAVLVYSDDDFSDNVGMGNVLADYLDAGGGVVVATFALDTESWGLLGRIVTGGYLPVSEGSYLYDTPLTLVADQPSHPILNGVTSFNGGTASFHEAVSTTTGATLVAHWTDGYPLVATKQLTAGRAVALNFFPPSSNARSDFWVASTDGSLLMANALLWASAVGPVGVFVQFTANPTNGLVPLPVQFTSPTNDSAGNAIISWNWNFGDGVGTSTNQNPTYTYTNAGTFFPSLSVSNSLGTLIVATGPSITVLVQNFSSQVMGTANLLGYWPFTPASQANSVVNGYTGTFLGDAVVGPAGSGPALQNMSNNTAVILDGNGSYVNTTLTGGLSSTGPNADQGSIIGWFKLTNLPSVAGHYFTIASESEDENDFDLQINTDNEIHFYTDCCNNSTADTNALTANDFGIWHFVAATFTSGVSRNIYLDGVLVASSVPGPHYPPGTGTFAMGASDVWPGRYFEGALADMAVFNRQLSATEVGNLYAVATAAAQISGFGGNGAGWTLNNEAGAPPSVTENVLNIVNGYGAANSAFYNIPQNISSFAASFVWQNTVASYPGDGMVFTVQNQGPHAVGGGGGALGYEGISPASGIAFNLYQTHVVGMGYAPLSTGNGSLVYQSTGAVYFDSTDPIAVTIVYTNSLLNVFLTDTTTLATYNTSFNVNLTSAVGGSTAYVGFTGASGEAESYQTISDFRFSPLSAASVQFTATPTNGLEPLTVQFTSPTNDSAGNAIISWNWNFGDGVGTSINQNPAYTYTNAGIFSPSLSVNNSLGALIVATGPSITVAPSTNAGGFDVVAGFSTNVNPNGVWSYGWSTNAGGQFQLMTASTSVDSGADAGWSDGLNAPYWCGIDKDFSGSAFANGTVVFDPDTLHMDPQSYASIVRFTAPSNGFYLVAGLFRMQDTDSDAHDLTILANGTTTNYYNFTSGGSYNSEYPFNFSTALTQGETMDFVVSCHNGDFRFLSTGLKATITNLVQVTEVITWTNPAPLTYGTALSSNQLNATANVRGSFAYAPASGTVLNAGINTLSVVFTPADTIDYRSVTDSVSLVVLTAPLTITVASTNWLEGQAFPQVFTGTITGLVNGDIITATYGSYATSNSPAGTYPIVPILADPDHRLPNYTVTTNEGTLTISAGVIVTSPVNGASFTTNQSITMSASANVANLQSLALYTNSVQIPGATTNAATLSTVLSNLAPGSYRLTAVATPSSGPAVASEAVDVTVNAPGTILINFDALDTSRGVMNDAALSSYLSDFGVTISDVAFGTSLEAATGLQAISQNSSATNELPVPSSLPNLFTQVGSSQPVTFTLDFAAPLQSFGFTRVELDTTNGSTISRPAWTASILDGSGTVLESVSEPLLLTNTNILARTFSLVGTNIASVRFDSDSQGGTAAFAAVMLDDLLLSTNVVASPISISLAQPASATAPANIQLSATATDSYANIDYVAFYSGPTLIGNASNAPYGMTWSNVLNGTYTLTSQLVDAAGYAEFSAPVTVTVLPGGNSLLVNFDALNASNAPVTNGPLAAYLAANGLSVASNSPGTIVAVENQDNVAGGGFVIASSQPNLLTQIGSNGPVSFTVGFSNLLGQFSFTRPELLANPFVTHPAWQVEAFDALGQLLASNNEPQISSSTNVPAQTYALTNSPNGGGIASVEFNSEGTGFTTFNAMLLDDFVLSTGSNLPPSVLITNPADGQVFTGLTGISIGAAATNRDGTITGVAFYYDGATLAGSAESSPFSITWNAPANGAYVLTAVATNNSGLTSTSAPVTIAVDTVFAIVTQPTNQTVGVSNSATFSVTTSPTNGVSYQWLSNNIPIFGATLSSYTAGSAQNSAPGSYTYSVIASIDGQHLTSSNAVLTVLGPPTISSPLSATNVTVDIGSNVTLSVSASEAVAGVSFYYQWQRNGQFIAGETNSSYTISNAQPSKSGDYQVLVANAVASQESPTFTVAVKFGNGVVNTTNDIFASSLAINPTNGPVAGNNVNSPASGELAYIATKPASNFLWFNWTADFNGVISLSTLGSDFDTLLGVYTGSDPASLTPVAEDDDSAGYFTSLVSFNCQSNTTYQIAVAGYNGATGNVVLYCPNFLMLDSNYLNVAEPAITQQPANQIAQAGQTVTLSVSATNATDFQWYFANAPVSGGNASNLVISNFPASAAGVYYVKAANGIGSVQSEPAAVEIAAQSTNGAPISLAEDKFTDAVVLTAETTQSQFRYRPEDTGGDVGGFTLSQSFSTVGATKEEGEPNHAGQPGGASYWYSYTEYRNGSLRFDTTNSTFNTILAIYTSSSSPASFKTLVNVGAAYTTNYVLKGQPSVLVSNLATTTYYIAIDGYLGASGAARLNVVFTPATNISTVPATNSQTVVAITSPANNSLTTNFNITVKGTITGSGGSQPVATNVLVTVNTNAPVFATLGAAHYTGVLIPANGGVEEVAQEITDWSITNVPLVLGANVITAQGTNPGIVSLPVTRTVFYVTNLPSPLVKSRLTLLTNPPGDGRITGQANNANLEINKVYTVKAVPIGNWVFTNWSSTNSLIPLPNSASLSFLMSSNLSLQANFVTNPFTALAGVYNGLFAPTNGVNEANSGFFTATIPAASRGAYSAKLLLDGGSYPFSGAFDLSLQAGKTVTGSGKTLMVVLQLTNDQMIGSVNDGATNSILQAYRALPETNYAGRYTVIIPPGGNAPTNEPGGYGYAILTNNQAGHVALSGRLGDGVAFSQSVLVATNGNIPLYASLYSRQGSLQGWLILSNNPTNTPAQTILGTNLSWIKISSRAGTLYPAGFTNTNITVLGSFYVPSNILVLTNGILTISNGNPADLLIYSNLTIADDKLVTNLDYPTNQLKGVITRGTGVLTVTFRPTGADSDTVAKGVVLQDNTATNATNAAGWFLDTDQSGYFLLKQQ